MEKRIVKSFRLPENLLVDLEKAAKREHRSLNNYVEVILLGAVTHEPNETTLAAMRDAKAGVNLTPVDTSSMESFMESMEK